MALELDGRIGAGNDLLDADLRDLLIVEGPAGTFLYASTGQNGGVSVYRVDGPGGLASLSDTRYFTTSGITMGSLDLISLDGVDRLMVGGTGNGALISYGFEADGDLSGLVLNDLPGSGVETASAVATIALNGSVTALYMVDGDTGALRAYVSDGAGAIAAQAGLTGGAAEFDLDGVVALEVVSAGTTSYLVAASEADGGSVRSYRIDANSGALEYVDSLGAANGLGIAAPSALQTFVAYGATWVILGAAGSGSLSVMKLAPNGQLDAADHILDTLATRFGGVTALEVVQVGAQVFVLAGGADDGLSLFSLLPDGRLVLMQSLAQTDGAGLMNVTGIEAVQVGDELRIFVTSGAALGLSQFSLSLDDLGLVIQGGGGVGGGQVLGTGAADLIMGTSAPEQLMGQGGDDILVASAAGTVLTGGAGADIFVLSPTIGTLQISDFEPGVDRLDLSGFGMLRSLSQLDLTSTGNGITIEYGTTTVVVRSRDGQTLNGADLWPGGFDTPDRAPIPPGPVVQIMLGSGADDIMTGGAEQDFIRGMGGDDRIRGGAGNDQVWGDAGNDTLFGETGKDRLWGGNGNDFLWGGDGNDRVWGEVGNDKLWGVDGRDKLYGGPGNDTILGGDGNDILRGGEGNDTLRGEADDDQIWGAGGRDKMFGGTGRDTLWGGDGNDTVWGRDGNDKLWGDADDDRLWGEDGRDKLYGGDGNDTILGGNGKDILRGGNGNDTLRGEADDDQIWGAGGRDKLFGGTGSDTIRGGNGNDTLWGRDGNDKIWGDAGDDWLWGEDGRDKLFGGDGKDFLKGGKGKDRLKGGDGWDILRGGDGSDTLGGGKGNDRLRGGAGDDRLTGGPGADILTGGPGRDVFIFGANGKGAAYGNDRIRDFTDGRDLILIDIAGVGFDDLTLTRQGADTVIATGAATITVTGVLPAELSASDFLFS